MPESIDLPTVDRITVDTIGEPGSRVFYLQARSGPTLLTVKVEKGQVSSLAAALRELLADLPALAQNAVAPGLESPVEPDWVAGGIGLSAYDEETQRVTLLLEQAVPEEEEGASARLGLTVSQMVALVARGDELVAGGRPPCPLCGNPLDPNGHSCPKTNGHLKR